MGIIKVCLPGTERESDNRVIKQIAAKLNLELIRQDINCYVYSGDTDALATFRKALSPLIEVEQNEYKENRSDVDELDYLIVFTRKLLFEEQKRSGTVSRKDKAGAQARVSLMSHLCETLAKRREELLTNRRNSNDVRFSRRNA